MKNKLFLIGFEWNASKKRDPEQEAEMPSFSEGSAIGEPDYIFELEEEYFIEKTT